MKFQNPVIDPFRKIIYKFTISDFNGLNNQIAEKIFRLFISGKLLACPLLRTNLKIGKIDCAVCGKVCLDAVYVGGACIKPII